jgi:hypothetical protein
MTLRGLRHPDGHGAIQSSWVKLGQVGRQVKSSQVESSPVEVLGVVRRRLHMEQSRQVKSSQVEVPGSVPKAASVSASAAQTGGSNTRDVIREQRRGGSQVPSLIDQSRTQRAHHHSGSLIITAIAHHHSGSLIITTARHHHGSQVGLIGPEFDRSAADQHEVRSSQVKSGQVESSQVMAADNVAAGHAR